LENNGQKRISQQPVKIKDLKMTKKEQGGNAGLENDGQKRRTG